MPTSTMHTSGRLRPLVLLACVFSAVGSVGCERDASEVQKVIPLPADESLQTQDNVLNQDGRFGIFWPPRHLNRSSSELDRALLQGALSVSETEQPGELEMHITLRRGASDADRKRWNKNLAFPQYDWMAKVRVWDHEGIWLWPNLPYLLRAHGEERVERYGGIDPGKGIDNDFAAVLIRPLDQKITEALVSAEWHAVDVESVDKHSLIHGARSDNFKIRVLPSVSSPRSGKLGVWLIYADFLGASLPKNWPTKAEYDGGILAYLEVTWLRMDDGHFKFETKHRVPPTETGFDWAAWSTGSAPLKKSLEMSWPSELTEATKP